MSRNKNRNLVLYCAILAVIYVVSILGAFSDMSSAFITGFKQGYSEAEKGNDSEIFHFEVEPEKGSYTFPSTITNEKTGQSMQAEIGSFMVYQTNPENPLTGSDKLLKGLNLFLSLITMIILIYIPIQTFKIIRSVMKEVIFDQNNIKRLRKIGFAVLLLFICKYVSAYSDCLVASHALQIHNYKPVVKETHMIFLFLGIVICIFAEILKKATVIKEEQDLTV